MRHGFTVVVMTIWKIYECGMKKILMPIPQVLLCSVRVEVCCAVSA
jgi:hypothetical protein